MHFLDLSPFSTLAFGIVSFLLTATLTSRLIAIRAGSTPTMVNVRDRINAWWVLVGLGLPVLAVGKGMTIVLFAALSFLTLREFISLTPTRQGDRLVLFSAFFVAVPFQYALVAIGWYGLFSILIPVYGFFAMAAMSTFAQDTQHFLERNAKIQWAVMVCVYGVSHAPALLFLEIPNHHGQQATMLLFFLLVVQLSDVMQYVFGKLLGRWKVAPILSPNKTVEGLVGGGVSASLVGALLHGFTPFSAWQAFLLSLAVVVAGFFGGLVLSAVKRSLGAKDWGSSIPGHGGVLDRLDSVAFSAPIFFHLVRYWFVP